MKPVYSAQGSLLVVSPSIVGATPRPFASPRETPTPLSILTGMLLSHDAKKDIAKRAGLSLKQVESHILVSNDPSRSQLVIKGLGPSRNEATQLVTHSIDVLAEISDRVADSTYARQISLVEQTLRREETRLEEASLAMMEFMAQMGAPVPRENLAASSAPFSRLKELEFELKTVQERLATIRQEARASAAAGLSVPTFLDANALWRNRLNELEYALVMANQQYGDEAPQVQLLKAQIEATKREGLQQIRANLDAIEKGLDPRIADLVAQEKVIQSQIATMKEIVDQAPEEAARLAELQLAVKTATETVATLRARLQTQEVEAQLEQVRWSILEEPFSTDPPINKRPVRNTALGLFLGFLAGVALTVFTLFSRVQSSEDMSATE